MMKDELLWTHKLSFDEALRGIDLNLTADDKKKTQLAKAFGMISLDQLSVTITTQPKPIISHKGWFHLRLSLKGVVTQECGVSLEAFSHEIEEELDIDCVHKDDYKPSEPETGERELSLDDLDEPDVIDGAEIDLGLYIIEALGAAYDPFARAPGVSFEEPQTEPEPSPFAVLSRLKLDK